MKKWELKSLDEIGFIGRGRSRNRPRNAPHLYGGEYPFVQTGDIKAANFVINEYTQTYTEAGLAQSKLWNAGTLCITIAANIADTAILGMDACFPDSIIGFVADDEKSDVRFVKYFFDIYQARMKSISTGAAQDNLSLEKLLTFKIPLPPLPTQKKIASILSAYDELIENNLKRIELLEEKTFLRYKEIIKTEKLEKKVLLDFGEIVTGKTPSTRNSDFFGDDIPFIKTPDMHSQIFIEHTNQSLSELGANSQDKKCLPALSLCVSCIGTAGILGITSKISQTNQQINSIIFQEPKNVFFFYVLMKDMKEYLDALGSSGSTFTNVNKKKFENIEVNVPSKLVLNEFISEHEPSFNMILNLQRQNTKLKEARDILLPKLMNGQIEV